MICLSETYLDSSTAFNNDNLEISDYNLTYSDHHLSISVGVFVFILPLRVCDISLLDDCINFELNIGDKLSRFVALYRSKSQTQDNFCYFHITLNLAWKIDRK